jgi:mRNA interferase MazF
MLLRKTLKLKRGEIWLADLNPRRGTEPGKTRPVLIIQAQALLDAGHPSTLIIPLTTRLLNNAEPLRIRIPATDNLKQESDLILDQLRAIDNRRIIKGPLTMLNPVLMDQVENAMCEVLDIAGKIGIAA